MKVIAGKTSMALRKGAHVATNRRIDWIIPIIALILLLLHMKGWL